MRKICVLLLFFQCFSMLPAQAQESELFERVANSPAWHRLLHYRKNFLGMLRSELDGPAFFFSPRGKTDPLAELHASAEAFQNGSLQVGKLKQHPQCAFPERYLFVKKELGLKIEDVACPMLDEYLARFHHPRSASLVFSSAYQDNPASMFGHTFLRINASPAEGSGAKLDLLDQGVSYAANVSPDENPLVFYWSGLTGGYPGAFTVVPYYAKVNEYNHAEARDLWEYDLNLNAEQTMRLVRHLWELETNSWFDYWFFDENCAFELLTLLEVANPDWNLADKAAAWVIPGETVKTIAREPGVVTSVKFRPSYRHKLLRRFERLTPEERREFHLLRKGEIKLGQVSDIRTLDALSASLVYKKQKNEGKLPDSEKELLTQVLIRRSELGSGPSASLASVADDENDSWESWNTWNTRPDFGHGATRLSLTSGVAGLATRPESHSGFYFQEIHWRSAYHDLLNDDLGYLRFSQIEFPNVTFRYYPSLADFRLERVGLLSVLSLFPLSTLEKKPSWGMELSYESPKDYGCLTCHTLRGRARAGFAASPLTSDLLFYTLALANMEVGESLRKGWRVGPGFQAAVLYNPIGPYKIHLRYEGVSDLFQNDRAHYSFELGADQSWSLSRSFELRAGYSLSQRYDEARLGIQYYY